MKHIGYIIALLLVSFSFAQENDEDLLETLKKANNYVYQGNVLIDEDDFVSAEMEYRKAISEQGTTVAGIYNLGNSYYKEGNFEEALYRHEQTIKVAISKAEKHKAYHNIGNILMNNEKCKEAVEAYKNALRNNPSDDETRYNLGIAKECAEEQKQNQDDGDGDDGDDENKDNKDENKDNEDQKDDQEKEGDDKEDKGEDGEDNEDKEDEGDQDKKDGEDKEDEDGKPKDEKEDKGKDGEEEKDKDGKPKDEKGQQGEQPQQQGRMSPQQIKNLLEAMNNQEQKVQEKMNAEKVKGVKIKTDKDW